MKGVKVNSRSGFTLIELLVFTAIFAATMVAFVMVLVSFTGVQVRQSGAAEVNQQSQFLLQIVQRYVEESSLVEMPVNTPTSTIKLRMGVSAADPTYVYLSGSDLYVRQTDGGQPERLNSSRVLISNVSFVKRENPPGHDSVSVTFTVTYNTQNIKERFAQTLDTAIARVNAATFDSNVIPSSTAVYDLGVSSQVWRSVNNLIYFSGSNVGIGVSGPQQRLEVDGGVRLNTTSGQPSCSAGGQSRGTLWLTQAGGVATDTLQLCVRRGDGSYSWVTIY
ncbi:type II secretion system protein [Candidatus Parcubacteria bacterium]|nr:MAG: type II secretion system protein [Candidatus Parcubacteria bacterium]